MKKFALVFAALAVLGVSVVCADTASVLPARFGRFYAVPSFSFVDKVYDDDGKLQDSPTPAKLFNLGFALEYGILNWLSAAVQWAPGATLWSDIDAGLQGDANMNDVADMFVGAKVLVVGQNAPVASDAMRAAVSLGVKVPFPGPDADEQFNNITGGDPATISTMDKHVFAWGFMLDYDYLLTDKFSINAHTKFTHYPVKSNALKHYGAPGLAQPVQSAIGSGAPPAMAKSLAKSQLENTEVDYGYELIFELEPAFTTPLADGVIFTAGLPFTYTMSPQAKIEGGADPELTGLFSTGPNVSVFLTNIFLPLEFKVGYTLPIAGIRANATHTAVVQVKVYFKI